MITGLRRSVPPSLAQELTDSADRPRVHRSGVAVSTTFRAIATLLAGALLTACVTREATAPARTFEAARPVVVQGAMDIEVKKLAGALENVTEEKVQGWTFWKGTLDGYPVVISKTLKGMSNAAAATVLAAERYHPVAIINQGTAGARADLTSSTSSSARIGTRLVQTGYRERAG